MEESYSEWRCQDSIYPMATNKKPPLALNDGRAAF
jgi:hypothetical protein